MFEAGVQFDSVYIDASHEFAECLANIQLWSALVRPGGLIAGHDYWPVFPGVMEAVNVAFEGGGDRRPRDADLVLEETRRMRIKPHVWVVGFPRCGTLSLCDALRVLGWNPIHNPRDWDQLEGHNAAADVFVTARWRDLKALFPKSLFILNTRLVDDWLKSLQCIPGFWESELLYDRYHRHAVYGTDDVHDHGALRAAWERHHDEVRTTIHALQLLEIGLPFSWGPLCQFLDVSLPGVPFPWKNRGTCVDVAVRTHWGPLIDATRESM